MNKEIRNIWGEVKVDLNKDKVTPLDILNAQAEALNKDVDKTNIFGAVMTLSIGKNGLIDTVKHVLRLFPKNGNDYNYRFIELVGKPDIDYPVTVYAYQSGNINFGECKDEGELYKTLIEIFKDPRLKIVFEQLKNIGNTIEGWRNEKE